MDLSIVTPVYNGEEIIYPLYDVMKSFIEINKVEWVIVNDGSTDNTKEILEEISKENSFVNVYTMDENSGPAKARHKGVELSRNEFVFLLDADDHIYQKRFVEFIKFCSNYKKEYDFFYAPLDVVSERKSIGSYEQRSNVRLKKIFIFNPLGFIKYSFPQPSSLMFKREFFLKYNRINDLKWGEDFLMYLCISKYGNGVRWNLPVSCYFIDGNGRGSKLSLRLRYELSKELYIESLKSSKVFSSILYSTYLTLRHVVSYVVKKIKKYR